MTTVPLTCCCIAEYCSSFVICNWKTYNSTTTKITSLLVKLIRLAYGPQRRTPNPVVLKRHVNTQLQRSHFGPIALRALDVKTPSTGHASTTMLIGLVLKVSVTYTNIKQSQTLLLCSFVLQVQHVICNISVAYAVRNPRQCR